MKKLVRTIITAFAVIIMQGSTVASAIDLPLVPADSSVTDSTVVSQTENNADTSKQPDDTKSDADKSPDTSSETASKTEDISSTVPDESDHGQTASEKDASDNTKSENISGRRLHN